FRRTTCPALSIKVSRIWKGFSSSWMRMPRLRSSRDSNETSNAPKRTREGKFFSSLMRPARGVDRKSTRLNSSHVAMSYAVFCLKNKAPAPCPDPPGITEDHHHADPGSHAHLHDGGSILWCERGHLLPRLHGQAAQR